jgi:hypothetical protein
MCSCVLPEIKEKFISMIYSLSIVILVVELANTTTVQYNADKLSHTYNGNGTHGNCFLHYSVKQGLNRVRGIMVALHASLDVTSDAATLIDEPIVRISSCCYVTEIALLLNFLYPSMPRFFIHIDIYILKTSSKETEHLAAVNLHQSPIREYQFRS